MKEVAAGYGRHLIAMRAAEMAAPEVVARLQRKMAVDASQKRVHTDLLLKNLAGLNGAKITLHGKANEKGHLFASIHKDEILMELKKQTHLEMHPDYVLLEKPIKALGSYEIPVEIEGKSGTFTVVVE